MALKDTLQRIDELQGKIDAVGKLDKDTLNKINYKFRLDWNYHSNAMEGNSLTREETRSVMINNITIEGKPLKDVLEIRGHDAVISDILKIGKGELGLSEKRIKDIHRAIMHEDNPEEKVKIGHWKTINNYLINYRGERIDFTPHAKVADEMHNLLNWLNKEVSAIKAGKEDAVHPAVLAFEFHYRYVTIHPFYDGNGRTGRILSNLILISFGYPPVIIKLEDRNVYNQYLADIQGYGGDMSLFLDFMAKQLVHSQELVLKAIEGEDIEEIDDLDKKIRLLELELEAVDPDNEVKEKLSQAVIVKMYHAWIADLLEKAIPVVQKFNKFFDGTQHRINLSTLGGVTFRNEPVVDVIKKMDERLTSPSGNFDATNSIQFNFSTHYGVFSKGGLNTFGCNYGFTIFFQEIKYLVTVDEFSDTNQRKRHEFKERLLHQPLSNEEIEKLVKILGDTIYQHIDFNTKKAGIR